MSERASERGGWAYLVNEVHHGVEVGEHRTHRDGRESRAHRHRREGVSEDRGVCRR